MQQNRRLLFSFYITIVVGLMAVAALLDYGFSIYQGTLESPEDRWAAAAVETIEAYLEGLPDDDRNAAAERLGGRLQLPIALIPGDAVVARGLDGGVLPVIDEDDGLVYYKRAGSLGAVIQLGPVPLADQGRYAGWIAPLFYLTIFLLVGFWLRPILRDLNILSEATAEFAADFRKPLTELGNTTSLSALARSIQDMAERIRGLIHGQQELTNALSHEMRTPLARIKFALAVMGDRDKTGVAAELDSISEDVGEIDQLVGSMLDYARLEHSGTERNWQLTPADEWLAEVVAKQDFGALEISVRTDVATSHVRVDPYLMELLISNLLVNATRFAQTKIAVSLSGHDDRYRLRVEDDGQGIARNDYEKVFQAFTRLDASRNKHTGGYGLGLAIVARIAVLHEGSVHVERSDLGGACFVVEWPRGETGG